MVVEAGSMVVVVVVGCGEAVGACVRHFCGQPLLTLRPCVHMSHETHVSVLVQNSLVSQSRWDVHWVCGAVDVVVNCVVVEDISVVVEVTSVVVEVTSVVVEVISVVVEVTAAALVDVVVTSVVVDVKPVLVVVVIFGVGEVVGASVLQSVWQQVSWQNRS